MTLPVAILSGGLATRLRPLTERIPKALVEVAGRPFVEHQLRLLRQHGIKRAVLCVGYLGESVKTALGDGSRYGLEIEYVFDGEVLLGTGGALRKALPLLGNMFFVLYGDTYLECAYEDIAAQFIASGKLGLMTVFRNTHQWDRSNVLFAHDHILRYDKFNPTSEMKYIDYGLLVFQDKVFEAYPADTSLDLATVCQPLIHRGELAGYEVTRRFYEIGSPAGLEETRRYLQQEQAG